MPDHLTFMRSITTVHLRPGDDAVTGEAFWRELLPTWTFLPVRDAQGEYTLRMRDVIGRLNPTALEKVLDGQVMLLEDVDRPAPNECLLSVNAARHEVSVRIFGRYLTDIQSTSEWFLHRLLDAQQHFLLTPHTRCFIALDIDGRRTDLTTGRVIPLRHKLWQGFYREHLYNVNITAAVVLLTLAVVLLVTPDGTHTPLGKAYGICERVLSAALMNVFLLVGAFYTYRRGRRVVEWEKP